MQAEKKGADCDGACQHQHQALQVRPRQEHPLRNFSTKTDRPGQMQLPGLPVLELPAGFRVCASSQAQRLAPDFSSIAMFLPPAVRLLRGH